MNKNIFLGFGVRPSDKDFFKITKQQYKKMAMFKLVIIN